MSITRVKIPIFRTRPPPSAPSSSSQGRRAAFRGLLTPADAFVQWKGKKPPDRNGHEANDTPALGLLGVGFRTRVRTLIGASVGVWRLE